MVAMKAMKVGLTQMKRPAAVAIGAPQVDDLDLLWDTDPTLAASLVLSPIGSADRLAMESGGAPKSSASSHEATTTIARKLPPQMQDFKDNGTWNKTFSGACNDYLVSLRDRFGYDVDSLIDEFKSCRGERKREIASKLILARDGSDLQAIEVESAYDKTESGEVEGWLSAFQVWDMEKLPPHPSTINSRMAALVVLDKRPHKNPVRARLGELEFKYRADQMTKRTKVHKAGTHVQNKRSLADGDEYEMAKKNLRKAIGDEDNAGVKKLKPSQKGLAPPKELTKEEHAAAAEDTMKKEWLKQAKVNVNKLKINELSMDQMRWRMADLDISKLIFKEFEQSHASVKKTISALNELVGLEKNASLKEYQSEKYKKVLKTATTLVEQLEVANSIIVKAKKAIDLAEM